MTFTLPELPYAQNALEPYISANTLSFHYGKHHQAYVDNLNKLVAGTPLEKAPRWKISSRNRRKTLPRPASSTTRPRCGTTLSTGIQ